MSFNNNRRGPQGGDRWEGFKGHPDQDPEFIKKQEGVFQQQTRQAGPPRANLKNVPFDQWDWSKNDPIFYQQFSKLPNYKIPDMYNQVKWQRYNIATREQGQHVRDFTPRVFIRKMRLEIAIVGFGICAGLMMPYMMRANNKARAGPQDAYTARYMQKQREEQMAEDRLMSGQVIPSESGQQPTSYQMTRQAPASKLDSFMHQQQAQEAEPNVHVFNFNLTNGYSENEQSEDGRLAHQERMAFAAEVEMMQAQNMQRNQAVQRAVNTGQFDTSERIGAESMGGLGSAGLRRQPTRRFYANEQDFHQYQSGQTVVEEDDSQGQGFQYGTSWKK